MHAVVVVGMGLNPEQRNETTKTSKIRHFYRELTAISREFVSRLLSQKKISLHTNLQLISALLLLHRTHIGIYVTHPTV